ncbi:MAG: zinc-dependent alcohol dehydrogenase family protein [Spirosomataceae bacterium]
MNAIYYEAFRQPLSVHTVPDPILQDDGVIIEVKASGLCLSDWHGWMGHDADIHLPHVPGHELAGVIVEKGKLVTRFKVGDRVTLPFVGGCGVCAECASGNHQVCPQQFQPGFTHWGSFAQYVGIHYASTNLVQLPDSIDFVTAASLGCRFATAFRAVVDQARVTGGQWVAVFGCGGVGLSAIMIAKALGAQIIALDINDQKLALAKRLGAHIGINSQHHPNVASHIHELTQGGAHVTIDALGHPEIVFQAVRSLRRRGKHIQVGLLPPEQAQPKIPLDRVIAYELELLGSHGMQAFRYEAMLAMITQGVLQPQQLVSQTISLSEAAQQLPLLRTETQPGIKVITDFTQ